MFAFMDFSPAKAAQLAVNSLAVLGGFFAGWAMFGFFAWWLDRVAFAKKSPPNLKRLIRLVGGVLVAILVAIIVFGHGHGWTLFGGGSPGDDNGGNPNPAATPPTSAEVPKSDAPPAPAKDLPPPGATAKVTLLGGDDVKGERFYLFDADPVAKTFDEITTALRAKKDTLAGKGLAVEIRFSESNTLSREHPAVYRLARWAAEHGVTVTFPAER